MELVGVWNFVFEDYAWQPRLKTKSRQLQKGKCAKHLDKKSIKCYNIDKPNESVTCNSFNRFNAVIRAISKGEN